MLAQLVSTTIATHAALHVKINEIRLPSCLGIDRLQLVTAVTGDGMYLPQ